MQLSKLHIFRIIRTKLGIKKKIDSMNNGASAVTGTNTQYRTPTSDIRMFARQDQKDKQIDMCESVGCSMSNNNSNLSLIDFIPNPC